MAYHAKAIQSLTELLGKVNKQETSNVIIELLKDNLASFSEKD